MALTTSPILRRLRSQPKKTTTPWMLHRFTPRKPRRCRQGCLRSSRLASSRRHLGVSSILKKSIPAASDGTSMVATIFSDARSTISTVPGSEPIPSTEINA